MQVIDMNEFIKKNARREIFALKTYVPGKPIEDVQRELGIFDIIKMASNENPLGPSPLALQAIKDNLERINYYPDGNCYYLKEKLAEIYDSDPSGLLLGNGSDEILRMIAETFINPGDEVVFAQPTFSEYEFTAGVMGARCTRIELKDYHHDLVVMGQAINDKTKIIYICNPNNPTGTLAGRAEIEKFMQQVPRDILIIFDEAYGEYADQDVFVSGREYIKAGRNVMVLKTFSKIYGLAGLRVGYALTTPEIAAAVKRVSEPFNVNLLGQAAALAALDDHHHLQMSREINNQGKAYLYEAFEEMGLDYIPAQSNFILVGMGRDCREVSTRMQQKGIIIRPCDSFGYPEHIRVTIGLPEHNERFIETLKKVLQETEEAQG